MKVLKQGVIPPPQKPWWIGQQVKCPRCGWCAEMEAGDDKNSGVTIVQQSILVVRQILVTCGTCSNRIQHIATDARMKAVADAIQKARVAQ